MLHDYVADFVSKLVLRVMNEMIQIQELDNEFRLKMHANKARNAL